MPRKKVSKPAGEPVQEQAVSAPPSPPPAPVVCGHVNRHSVGLDKKLDNISCDLKPGHSGDHEGWHTEYQRHDVTKVVKGEEIITIEYEPVVVRRQWGDAAGVPVAEIPPPTPIAPPTMRDLEARVQQLEKRPR